MVTLNFHLKEEKRVLFQADDLGRDSGTNQRIFAAWRHGPVRGASLLVNFASFSREAALMASSEGLSCGLHFNVSEGRPLSESDEISTLLSPRGEFFTPSQFLFRFKRGLIDHAHLVKECRAQVAQFISFGLMPRRFDSHHHVHAMPGVFPVLESILSESGFRFVRTPSEPFSWRSLFQAGRALEGVFLTSWGRSLQRYLRAKKAWHTSNHFRGIYAQQPNFSCASLIRQLSGLPPGLTEVMVHPGHPGEMEVLTDERIQRLIVEKDLVLVSP